MRNTSANLFRRTVMAGAVGIFALLASGGTALALQPADEGGDSPLCQMAHELGATPEEMELLGCMGEH